MIRKIPYAEIDFCKYGQCLEASVQNNFYAQKVILDQRCDSWELLVYDDYFAVMPVPLKKKWGVSFVLMPLFIQQLGVFSPVEDSNLNNDFLAFLKKNYLVYQYHFNSSNVFSTVLPLRRNYTIGSGDFSTQRKKYFKGRKSAVKSAKNLEVKKLFLEVIPEKFIFENAKGLRKPKDLRAFSKYLKFLETNGLLLLYGVYDGRDLISLAFLTHFEKKLHLLALANDPTKLKKNAASFLLNYLLEEYMQHFSFDFMGGNQRGIELFFKSFGAENSPYPAYSDAKISLLRKIIFFR